VVAGVRVSVPVTCGAAAFALLTVTLTLLGGAFLSVP
jgi:hypothetical protein